MNYDEFAFLNQQLAGMLKNGIPLEGALRQLCADIQHGPLRIELEQLEADLAKGVPLKTALGARKLPEFYVQMLQVGIQSNDLPGMLTMLADYYQRVNSIWTRLKGLMVYPVIVLFVTTALSVGLAVMTITLAKTIAVDLLGRQVSPGIAVGLLFPPLLLVLVLAAVLLTLGIPGLRRSLRWRLPGFKEAALGQFASAMGLMLKRGCHLSDALNLAADLEKETHLGQELAAWKSRLAGGLGKFAEFASPSRIFPPLFIWLVGKAGEDLAGGFNRAAEIYYARAMNRVDMLLYAFLPVAVLVLGVMILGQLFPFLRTIAGFLDMIGSVGD